MLPSKYSVILWVEKSQDRNMSLLLAPPCMEAGGEAPAMEAVQPPSLMLGMLKKIIWTEVFPEKHLLLKPHLAVWYDYDFPSNHSKNVK